MGKRGADGGRSQDSFEGASATASPDSGVWTKLRKDVPLNSPPPKEHSDAGLIFFCSNTSLGDFDAFDRFCTKNDWNMVKIFNNGPSRYTGIRQEFDRPCAGKTREK